MAGWNGSGVFTRIYSWVADKNAGIDISSSRMDADTDNITGNGFNNCLTRDGQGAATNNLPMNGFAHTDVADATVPGQYASINQVQDGSALFAVGGGTGNTVTAAFLPFFTALEDGMQLNVRMPGANTVTNPTFAPDGLTADVITKLGGAVLNTPEYATDQEVVLRYVAAGPRWELVTPSYITGQLQSVIFTTAGTWTVPANLSVSTIVKITAIGGGGGGGGVSTTANIAGGGGGSGGVGIGWFSGFTPGATVTLTGTGGVLGAAGTQGASTGGNGGAGGHTEVQYNSVNIIDSQGGAGGTGATSAAYAVGGAQGTSTVTASGSGLTLESSINFGAQAGGVGIGAYFSGGGGSNLYGLGGQQRPQTGTVSNGFFGENGGGGAGATSQSGSGGLGGGGGVGLVLIEWIG